jgi:hypothetical protein
MPVPCQNSSSRMQGTRSGRWRRSQALGSLLPRASTRTIALLAMILSLAVELSQLYHAPWIDSIRQTTLGGLILGFGFLWSDLACYAVGVGLGVILELIVLAALYPRRSTT